MKSLIAPLAGLAVLAAGTGAALAAPPAYCALYAREYANQFTQAAGEKPGAEPKIQDEAYYRCLNMDQEPEMPATSAYYGTSVDTAGQGGPLEPVTSSAAAPSDKSAGPATDQAAAAPAGAPGTAPLAPAAPAKPATMTADNGPTARSYTGGKQPWTPEWLAACKKYFPNSFNEKDGTILPHGAEQAGVLPVGSGPAGRRLTASCRRS